MRNESRHRRNPIRVLLAGASAGAMALVMALAMAPPVTAAGYSPDPVSNVNVEVRPGALAISWDAPAYTGSSTYYGPATMKEYWVSVWPDYSGNVFGTYGSCTTQTTSCVITGLTNGASYTVDITAYNNSYFSSKVTTGTFSPCCNIPRSPARVVAAAADGVVEASWEPATGTGIGPVITYTATTSPPGGYCVTVTQTCRFTGLSNGTTYTVSVTAANIGGTSAPSGSNAVMPKGVPGQPVGVGAAVNKGAVVVSWTPPATTGGTPITGYVVTSQPEGGQCQSAGTAAQCAVSGLVPGTTYVFTVAAANEAGTGPMSAPSAPLVMVKSPGTTGEVNVRFSGTTATISWSKPESNGGLPISKYTVVTAPGGKSCTTKRLSCSIRGLSPGVTYQFTVQAINAMGAGSKESSPPTSAPLPPPKPTPTYN